MSGHLTFGKETVKTFAKVRQLDPNTYTAWRCMQHSPTVFMEGEGGRPSEYFLQQVWEHQRIVRDRLRTTDGRPLAVLHPGFWNKEAGPDFREAVVRVGDEPPRCGDVEIDLESSGWRGHGHDANAAYRNVILHVVWQGMEIQAIPTLALEHCLDATTPELEKWFEAELTSIPEHMLGQCQPPLARFDDEAVAELLRQAGRVRFERKGELYRARAKQVGWEKALWEGLFGALGYKNNTWPMRRLAEVGLDAASGLDNGSVRALQAVWFGISGLLPHELGRYRPQTARHLKEAWDLWWRERDRFAGVVIPRALWRLHGLRPANQPLRRIALAAHWALDAGFFNRIESWFIEEVSQNQLGASLLGALQVEQDDFWSWHWSLRSSRLKEPQALLGMQRATDLAVNVLLPWFWIRAVVGGRKEWQERAIERYEQWPAGEDNAALRKVRRRLFGPRRQTLNRALLQQGLLQIAKDFCGRTNSLCDDCKFPGLVESLFSHP